MTPEIEQWLAPLLDALVAQNAGSDTLARFMEMSASNDPGGRIGRVDWIRLGQLMREELGWHHYPADPPTSL